MKGFSVDLSDSIPDIEHIASTWRQAFRWSPIELRKNQDFRYYGGLIFASALMNRCSIELDKTKSDEEQKLYSDWPKMEKAFSCKYCYKFKVQYASDLQEIFLILSEDTQRIDEFICIDYTFRSHDSLSTIEEVLLFML